MRSPKQKTKQKQLAESKKGKKKGSTKVRGVDIPKSEVSMKGKKKDERKVKSSGVFW